MNDESGSAKTNKPPTGEEMRNNPSVRSYLLTMLKACYDPKGKAEGEHGGWIYSSPEFPETFCFRLTRLRFPRAVDLSNPPDLSHLGLWIVGTFHTHPIRDERGRRPSKPGDRGIGDNVEADTEVQQRYGVPGLMINYLEEIYVYGPASRLLDWGGGRGFPGRAFR